MATAAVIVQNLVAQVSTYPGALGEGGLGVFPLGGELNQSGPIIANLSSQLGKLSVFTYVQVPVSVTASDLLLPLSISASVQNAIAITLSSQLGDLQLLSNAVISEVGVTVASLNEQLGDLTLTSSANVNVVASLSESLGALTLLSDVNVVQLGEIVATLNETLGELNLISHVRNFGIKRPCERTPDQFQREPVRV